MQLCGSCHYIHSCYVVHAIISIHVIFSKILAINLIIENFKENVDNELLEMKE